LVNGRYNSKETYVYPLMNTGYRRSLFQGGRRHCLPLERGGGKPKRAVKERGGVVPYPTSSKRQRGVNVNKWRVTGPKEAKVNAQGLFLYKTLRRKRCRESAPGNFRRNEKCVIGTHQQWLQSKRTSGHLFGTAGKPDREHNNIIHGGREGERRKNPNQSLAKQGGTHARENNNWGLQGHTNGVRWKKPPATVFAFRRSLTDNSSLQ